MKKTIIWLIFIWAVFIMCSCSTSQSENVTKNIKPVSITVASDLELEERVKADVENTISQMNQALESLRSEIDSYRKYINSKSKVEKFYAETKNSTCQLCMRLREYCEEYMEGIILSDKFPEEKTDDLDRLYDVAYKYACGKIYDGIYKGVVDEVYNVFYEGVLDSPDKVSEYNRWFNVRTEEYEQWLDLKFEVYSGWYDTSTDIYELWLDIRNKIIYDNTEKSLKILRSFTDETKKLYTR